MYALESCQLAHGNGSNLNEVPNSKEVEIVTSHLKQTPLELLQLVLLWPLLYYLVCSQSLSLHQGEGGGVSLFTHLVFLVGM